MPFLYWDDSTWNVFQLTGAAPPPPYVRFTTTGATFTPAVELAEQSTATVTWLVEESLATVTGVTPTIDFGSAATRHVQMSVVDSNGSALGDVVTVNLGFDHDNDAGLYNMGAGYDKAPEAVTQAEDINLLTGLVRFAAANTPISGPLDFTGCAALEYIECYNGSISGLTLTGCTSLIRLCMEHDALDELDLNPVAGNLRDLRCATAQDGELTLTTLTSPLAALYHFCVRGQTLHGHPTAAQLPVVVERWEWDCALTGACTAASSALQLLWASGNSYTSANLTDQFPTGRMGSLDLSNNALTAVTLTGCEGLGVIALNNNNLNPAAVDATLVEVESWDTSGGSLDLSGNGIPSETGLAAVTALEGRDWTVTVASNPDVVGVPADDFERADATGLAAVRNGWFTPGVANANIVSGDLVRTDFAQYQLLLNPGGGQLPADYTVAASVPAATMGSYWGLVGRWSGGTGVRLLFANDRNSITIGDAGGWDWNNVTVSEPTFPESWSNDAIDHTVAMQMTGTTITIICDNQATATATCATNAAVTGTGYGCCGEGNNRAWHSIGSLGS